MDEQKTQNNKSCCNPKVIIGIVLLVVVGIAFITGFIWFAVSGLISDKVACTMEAKECPDGSYVGRVPSSCEFAQCPIKQATGRTVTDNKFYCVQPEDCLATCNEPGCYNKKYYQRMYDCEALIKHSCVCLDNVCVKKTEADNISLEDWQIYRSVKGGFELSAPTDWDYYESISTVADGVDLFTFHNKDATTSINEYDYVQLNIRIKQNKLNLSIEDYYNGEKQVDLFNAVRGGYDKIIVGGKDAIWFKEKDKIGADVIIIPLEGRFIELDSANSNKKTYNKIISTFKFIEPLESDTSDWLMYKSEEAGLSFRYPEEWMEDGSRQYNILKTKSLHQTQEIHDGTGEVNKFKEPSARIRLWVYGDDYSIDDWFYKHCQRSNEKRADLVIGKDKYYAERCQFSLLCEFGYCYSQYDVIIQNEQTGNKLINMSLIVGEEFTAEEVQKNSEYYFPVFELILSTLKFF